MATPMKKAKYAKKKVFRASLILITPAVCVILLFNIWPALKYSVAAFLNWRPPQQLQDASFVGLKWFKEILNYYKLPQLIRNSVILGIWDIALLPVPLILALAAHHCGSVKIKKTLEITSLIPMFIPSVTIAAITHKILSTEGLLNQMLSLVGLAGENWLLHGELFYAYFSLSSMWASLGFPCLIYRACLTASSRDLHAAAKLYGASLLTRIIKIDMPLCASTFLINLVMKVAGILNTSTERLLLFSNTANSRYSTTLDLYAYELTFKGSMMPNYSKAIALLLMTTVVNIVLLSIARKATKKKENIYE